MQKQHKSRVVVDSKTDDDGRRESRTEQSEQSKKTRFPVKAREGNRFILSSFDQSPSLLLLPSSSFVVSSFYCIRLSLQYTATLAASAFALVCPRVCMSLSLLPLPRTSFRTHRFALTDRSLGISSRCKELSPLLFLLTCKSREMQVKGARFSCSDVLILQTVLLPLSLSLLSTPVSCFSQ